MGKALALLVVGFFAMYMGVKSYDGYESDTEHLFQGEMVEITCDPQGGPVSGAGWMAPSAQTACQKERKQQKDRTPYWVAGGVVLAYFGASGVKKSRAG
jgi:hypothetical protein